MRGLERLSNGVEWALDEEDHEGLGLMIMTETFRHTLAQAETYRSAARTLLSAVIAIKTAALVYTSTTILLLNHHVRIAITGQSPQA